MPWKQRNKQTKRKEETDSMECRTLNKYIPSVAPVAYCLNMYLVKIVIKMTCIGVFGIHFNVTNL